MVASIFTILFICICFLDDWKSFHIFLFDFDVNAQQDKTFRSKLLHQQF